MKQGQINASEGNSCIVECRQCGKVLKASSLGCHLADVHDIYQQAVVAKELLEDRPLSSIRYTLSCTHELCRVRTRAVPGDYEAVG
jgi:hypothetical protein